jgi:hypothetical protein
MFFYSRNYAAPQAGRRAAAFAYRPPVPFLRIPFADFPSFFSLTSFLHFQHSSGTFAARRTLARV